LQTFVSRCFQMNIVSASFFFQNPILASPRHDVLSPFSHRSLKPPLSCGEHFLSCESRRAMLFFSPRYVHLCLPPPCPQNVRTLFFVLCVFFDFDAPFSQSNPVSLLCKKHCLLFRPVLASFSVLRAFPSVSALFNSWTRDVSP